MAKLRFFQAYDIRDLPDGEPSYRSRQMTLSDNVSTLTLVNDDETMFRPKHPAAAMLNWGEITSGGATAAHLTGARVPGFALLGADGATRARDLLSGDDRIIGSAESDRLFGFAGDDTITGGHGRDVMTGGGGADTFRFTSVAQSPAGAADLITDFRPGRDTIDLRAIDARHGVAGDQGFDFIDRADFSGTAGELRVAGHRLQADVDGDGHADFTLRFGQKAGLPGADDLLL